MHLFYTPDITGKIYTLDPIESKHAVKVLRLAVGDEIQLIDGKGGFYTAKIENADPKRCIVEIISEQKEYGKRDHYLHIAIAPTKSNDRFEWFLEKATEIGIDEITPVVCEHSERKTIKPERFEKIIVSAVKQSIKAYKPTLNPLTDFRDFIRSGSQHDKFIAHCEENEKTLLKSAYHKGKGAVILIGPEGDFSTKEIELAREYNFKEISLGKSRLRTETAGIVACHTINILND